MGSYREKGLAHRECSITWHVLAQEQGGPLVSARSDLSWVKPCNLLVV